MAASHTPNLNLNKPDRQDYTNVITDINDNMDKIDTGYGTLNSNLANRVMFNTANHSTLSGLITTIQSYSTNDVFITRTAGNIGLFTNGETYGAVVIILKSSSNNAYYFAFSRNNCAVGNIGLNSGTVTIIHDIV